MQPTKPVRTFCGPFATEAFPRDTATSAVQRTPSPRSSSAKSSRPLLVAGYQGLAGCSQTCGLPLVVFTPCRPYLLTPVGGVRPYAFLPQLLLFVAVRPPIL